MVCKANVKRCADGILALTYSKCQDKRIAAFNLKEDFVMLLDMSAGKGKMINFRVSARHAVEFKAACNARGKGMTTVLKEFILRYISSVRDSDPSGFAAELSLIDDPGVIPVEPNDLESNAKGTDRNRRKA